VFRSNAHTYAQIIDDTVGHTLVAASTLEPSVREQFAEAENGNLRRVSEASVVGRMIAERAKEKGINQVVFDRGGYKYHGRVKAVADAARESGLEF
jgi:large subunit ribosomal protein L18